MNSQDGVTSGMNDSGTDSKSGTELTQGRSGFDLENTRRKLIAKRVAAGADTPIGHRCSNLIEQLEHFARYARAENEGQRERLGKLIRRKMESRILLLEAAMRVIMSHGLLNAFSHELNHPPQREGEKTEYDVLLAERDRYRETLEKIAGQPQCVLEAMQAKAALDNIGPPVPNGER